MKFNNKLDLAEYIQVVEEIVDDFFDEFNNFCPHIGKIHAVCVYYNHCVEIEDGDEITKHPIDNIDDMQQLFDNEEFMDNFQNAIEPYEDEFSHTLTFSNAYDDALNIVHYRNNNAHSFALAMTSGFNDILKSFREMFSADDIKAFTDIVSQVKDEKFNADAILKAYENSERFKENTKEIEEESKIIKLPEQR